MCLQCLGSVGSLWVVCGQCVGSVCAVCGLCVRFVYYSSRYQLKKWHCEKTSDATI